MVHQAWTDRRALQTLNKLRVASHHLTKRKEGVHLQGKSFVVPTYYVLFKSAKSGRQNISVKVFMSVLAPPLIPWG